MTENVRIKQRERDVRQKQQQSLDTKVDKTRTFRAEIVSVNGSIWYNQNQRKVWYRKLSGGQPAWVRCVRLEPEEGMGVIIGPVEGSPELEVLFDDPTLRDGLLGRSWLSLQSQDLEPGGRQQIFLYPEVFVPLMAYPNPTGLLINVVAGDYYFGEDRKSFGGVLNRDLSASVPGAGLNRYAGLYLDANNTLQSIDGSTAAIGVTPPEPAWPADVFRLAVVRLINGQVDIAYANIKNRRVFFTEPEADVGTKLYLHTNFW